VSTGIGLPVEQIVSLKTPQVRDSSITSPYHVAFGERNIYGMRVLGDGADGGSGDKNRKGEQPI
jgi:hypothetical protein